MTTKVCSACKEEKPLSAFIESKGYRDGHTGTCRSCRSAYSKAYRVEHSDRIRCYRRSRATEDQAYKKQWFQRNKDRLRPSKKAYALLHADENRVYWRNYGKMWRTKNRQRWLLAKRVRQHNRHRAVKDLSLQTVQMVYEDNIIRYGTLTCELCFKPIKFGEDSIDHKVPVVRRAEFPQVDINGRDNLCVAHGNRSQEQCNARKHTQTLEEWFLRTAQVERL